MEREVAEEFLREYEALCKRYGVYVGACGCCDSPWLVRAISDSEIEEHVRHLREQLEEEEEEREASLDPVDLAKVLARLAGFLGGLSILSTALEERRGDGCNGQAARA